MSIRIFSNYLHLPIFLLALADWVVLILAVYAANALLPHFDPAATFWRPALIFSTLSFIALLSLGLYRSNQRFLYVGSLMRAFSGLLIGGAAAAFIFYLVPGWSIDRIHLLASGMFAFAGTALLRAVFYRVIDENLFKRNVLVYGWAYARRVSRGCAAAPTSADFDCTAMSRRTAIAVAEMASGYCPSTGRSLTTPWATTSTKLSLPSMTGDGTSR